MSFSWSSWTSENEPLCVIHCSNYSEGWVKFIGQISQQGDVENLNCDESSFGDAFVKLNHTRLSRKTPCPKPVETSFYFLTVPFKNVSSVSIFSDVRYSSLILASSLCAQHFERLRKQHTFSHAPHEPSFSPHSVQRLLRRNKSKNPTISE